MRVEPELASRLIRAGNRLTSCGQVTRNCAQRGDWDAERTAKRLGEVETDLAETRAEIGAVREALERLAATPVRTAPVAPPPPVFAPVRRPTEAPAPAARPPRPARPAPAPRPARPVVPRGPTLRERAEAAGLLGARGLALAGGVVTILGVVFLFVLAANRGWIGPEARLALGAVVSASAVGAGFWIRRRFGAFQAALASVGAGIAGGYATLLAAGALYDFVPLWAGLLIAAAIAAVGAAIAVSWRSETVAALGLVGAIAVPGLASIGLGLSVAGTAFVAVVLAATLLLAIRERWDALLFAAVGASLPQLFALVGWPLAGESGRTMVLAAVFSAIYLAAGLLLQRRAQTPRIDPLASAFVSGGATLATWSAFKLVDGTVLGVDAVGVVILGVAAVYGVLCGLAFTRHRELSILLAAVAAVVGAVAMSQLTGGATLAIVWAIEGAAFAWLAVRIGEARFQLAALGYLGLALVHVLAFEAPPRLLYEASSDPASGFAALLVVAASFACFALAARRWPPARDEEREGWLGPFVQQLRGALEVERIGAYAVSAALTLYAVSLGVLWIAQQALDGSTTARFQWGHVVVGGLWAALGCALVCLGDGGRRRMPWAAGLTVLAFALVDFLVFEHKTLPVTNWSVAALVLAVALLVAGLVDGLRGQRDPTLPAVLGLLASLGLATGAAVALVGGTVASVDAEGLTLLLGGVFYGLLAFAVLRFSSRRNLGTLLWVEALGLGLAAAPLLVLDTALVASLAVSAVAFAAIGRTAREPRLQLGALVPLVGAIGYTLAALAKPRELYVELVSPGDGVGALLLCAGALVALLLLARPAERPASDPLDTLLDRAVPDFRVVSAWATSALLLYAASFGVLQVAQWIDAGSTLSNFEWGRVAVTGLWASVGAAAVVLGRAGRRPWWSAGVLLLAVTAADSLLFEWDTLSGPQWSLAAAFLAAALLAAGVADGLTSRADPGGVSIPGLLGSLAFGAAACAVYLDGTALGIALLGIAALYALTALAVLRGTARRNLGTLLWVEGLGLGLAAAPLLVLDTALVASLAVSAVAFAAIGRTAREPRLQLGALVPLVGAIGYTLAALATPRQLYVELVSPGDGVGALLLCVAAVAAMRLLVPPGPRRRSDRLDLKFADAASGFHLVAAWVAAVLALDAVSLGVLQLAQWIDGGSVLSNFQWGRVAVTGVWAAAGAALVMLGRAGEHPAPRHAGLTLLAFALADFVAFEVATFPGVAWAVSAAVLAVALAVAGLADSLLGRRDPGQVALVALPVSAALAGAACAEVFEGSTEGAVLLAVAACYGVLAVGAASVPRRNLATLLSVPSLALALAAAPLLVLNTALVAALTIGSTALAFVAARAREPRLQLAAAGLLAGAVGYTLAVLATPRQLFADTADPGRGVVALLLCAGAVLALNVLARPVAPDRPDRFDGVVARLLPGLRTGTAWAAAVLALDAASLAVLQLTSWASGSFETGQMFVSMLWGVVALAALTTGLIAGWARMRLAGFLLFGFTLAKIFLYDLSSLSSMARALSFLAVGAVLLAAGFFYQRLTGGGRRGRGGPPPAPAIG